MPPVASTLAKSTEANAERGGRASSSRVHGAEGIALLATTAILLALVPSGIRAAEDPAEEADPFAPPAVVHVAVDQPIAAVRPGGRVRAALQVTIDPTWHINANRPYEDFLIPTEVLLDEGAPAEIAEIRYPEPHDVELSFSETPMAVYEGDQQIGVELWIPDGTPDGKMTVTGIFTSQACNDQMCMPPADAPFAIDVEVSSTGEDVVATSGASDLWASGAGTASAGPATRAAPAATGEFDTSRGLLVTFLLVFLGGLALNLTPCIYPMIPITISIFGAQGGGPRRALKLAIFYVIGMAITYSLLGTMAALTGSLLGSALQNPIVLVFVALVMVGLALSMFGLYDIAIPDSLSRLASSNRQGAIGTLLMGMTVGIIAAPCIGPFVLGLLTYVGATGSPALGFSLFFVLALGLGAPFLVLATASGSLSALPRSGSWMIWVKKIFGFILLGMAVYFLTRSDRLIPESLFFPLCAAIAVAAALKLWIFDHTRTPWAAFSRIKMMTGILCLLVAAGLMVAPRFLTPPEGIAWTDYDEEAVMAAASAGRPVIIDFSAAWCIPCKELDHLTFAAPPVVERARDFVTLKADLTDSRSPAVKALKDRYGVRGVPTVVFLLPDGSEIEHLRFTGVISPEEFLEKMQYALDQNESGEA